MELERVMELLLGLMAMSTQVHLLMAIFTEQALLLGLAAMSTQVHL